MTKPSVRTWDFSALNREHGWAWPWEHTVSQSMIFGRLAPAVSRRASTRDVRPEDDLIQLRRDLPVLPLAAYDVWEPGTNPRHLLKEFREIVTADEETEPWEDPELQSYPEELQLARGRLAGLVVQESGFVRRGDVAANIVIGTHAAPGYPRRPGVAVASVGDSDNRTGGLATYNTVAVDWRALNLSRVMWVIKREFGRPGWSMIRELWLEFLAGAQQERRSMMAPLAESLAIAIKRAAARGVDVRPDVLESADHWQDVVEELLTMKNTETEEGAEAPVWAGTFSPADKLAKANERLQAKLARGRSSGTAPRAPASKAQPFETVSIDAEVLAAQGDEIAGLKADIFTLQKRWDEFTTDYDSDSGALEGLSSRVEAADRRVDELARVVEELREDLGEDGTDVPNTTT